MRTLAAWCIICLGLTAGRTSASPQEEAAGALEVPFSGCYGQVEVGGPFAGIEFHRSRPMPSRVSFYAPVANSIDVSTDYWKRDQSLPFLLAVRVDGGKAENLGAIGWQYRVSPSRVEFTRLRQGLSYTVGYSFCRKTPAFVQRVLVRNPSTMQKRVEVYLHELLALRSCQTYNRFDSATVTISPDRRTVTASYSEPQLGGASVFVIHAGALPDTVMLDAERLAVADTGWSTWLSGNHTAPSPRTIPSPRRRAFCAAVYSRLLMPGDSLEIIQVVGSCSTADVRRVAEQAQDRWRADASSYSTFIDSCARMGVSTGLSDVDSSAVYARAITEANQHFLNGTLVPMPCPAEYNFFFTHDVLLTGLASTLFDTGRVKRNLEYIVAHASGDTIPHAYYWRDDGFKTELCTSDNWNHLWFILLTGAYYRHSADSASARTFYPFVSRSLAEMLRQYGADSVMHAYRPDWWDLGRKEGARSFITILMIRALEEYMALSTALHANPDSLARYESIDATLRQGLIRRLWDPSLAYLVNYAGGEEDKHLYMGSLLAPALGLLPPSMAVPMLAAASNGLNAEDVGIRTVAPPDFNTDSIRTYFKIVGNEAGDPFLYINGGVWSHANAWYTMALHRAGAADAALAFYRRTMTITGIVNSPMGQPAMYEYRFSDPSSPDYGRIDKPSFLWAGGFALQTLYQLMGEEETAWNISLGNNLPAAFHDVSYPLAFGATAHVTQHGCGRFLQHCDVDGREIPSKVLPEDCRNARSITISLDTACVASVVEAVNATLERITSSDGSLSMSIKTFKGHHVEIQGTGSVPPSTVLIDGLKDGTVSSMPCKGGVSWGVEFIGSGNSQNIRIGF